MDNSAGGDINQETETASKELPDSNVQSEDNVFSCFHKSYLQLTSVMSNEGKQRTENTNDEVRGIIESMIKELDSNIQKTTKEDKSYMRFYGMKVFLIHILSKLVEESEAVILLENIYEEVKPYICNPEVTYSGFLIMNTLSTLIQKKNSLDRIKGILEECQNVYNSLKYTNKNENYYSGKELFTADTEMTSNKEARLKFEKLAITNLLFLGSVYEKLGNHYKDIVCYHAAFSRMLNKGLVSPYKWVDFTTRLACVFIDDNNFKDARHHLSAATHVHEILEGKNKTSNDNAVKELLKTNAIHLALAWVRYCVLLFEKSKDEDRTKFIILYKNGYLFPNNMTSQIDKLNMNDQYEDHILNERNIVLQNQRFIDTIDKELVDDDHDKLDEYNDIIRKKDIGYGDVLNKIEKQNKNEDDSPNDYKEDAKEKSGNEDVKNPNDKCIDKNEQFDRIKILDNSKESENSMKNNSESSNNQFIQDDTDEEIAIKDENVFKTINKTFKNDFMAKEFKENDCIENDSNLVFQSLGYLPIEHTVTKDLIQNPDEARDLFKFACGWSKQAQIFHPKSKDFYSHVHVILNMVSLYRLCAYFQGRDNLEYRISLEQTRENLLEQLVTELTELQPESHLHVRLYQEMALLNIDLAMLNMCNIYNIHADDTYKLCALAEIQSHINHTYIVGDMLEKSTEIIDQEKCNKEIIDDPEEGMPKETVNAK